MFLVRGMKIRNRKKNTSAKMVKTTKGERRAYLYVSPSVKF